VVWGLPENPPNEAIIPEGRIDLNRKLILAKQVARLQDKPCDQYNR
jgi:hypothetical protein